MKLNTLFFAAVCAGTLFNSCVDKTARENQLKYTHTTLVDGDAFSAFQKIGEAAQVGVIVAEHEEANGDAKSKEVAAKVKAYYAELIPSLDTIARTVQIDFPIKGVPAPELTTAHAADSTASTNVKHTDYVHNAQHEIGLIKEQLTRLTRNTNEDLRAFAEKQVSIVSEVYKQIGGKEEAHSHH